MVDVTQADRDAAQALCASGWTHAMEAFARHREAALTTAQAQAAAQEQRIAELEQALRAHNVIAANGDEITVADELEQAAGTLEAFVAANGEYSLLDCTDNDDTPYQSEWMAGLMDHAHINARTLRKWARTLRAALGEQQ